MALEVGAPLVLRKLPRALAALGLSATMLPACVTVEVPLGVSSPSFLVGCPPVILNAHAYIERTRQLVRKHTLYNPTPGTRQKTYLTSQIS